MEKPKILVILGPTASGKSDLAVAIAKILESKKKSTRNGLTYHLNGAEIISADSRQVYKGLDIGTGKITKKEMKKIPHHLLDVASPKKIFTVSDFLRLTNSIIRQIVNRGKIPIICGGTGFYIDTLLGEKAIPEAPPNPKLRKELEQKTTEELFEILQKLDPVRAKNIDAKNPRRLVRAIEIAKALGKIPRIESGVMKYEVCKIGIAPQKEITLPHPSFILREGKKGKGFILDENELKKRISKRIEKWFKQGLIKEVQNLHRKGLSWKRMSEIGLEYKLMSEYFLSKTRFSPINDKKLLKNNGKGIKKKCQGSPLTVKELKKKMAEKTWQYAKRQMTWFKKDKSIVWLPPKIKLVEKEVIKFLYH